MCRCADEADIGALVVQALTRDEFAQRALRSEHLAAGDRVKVEADLQSIGRDDVALESAVSRLRLKPSGTSVTWYALEPAECRYRLTSSPASRRGQHCLALRRWLGWRTDVSRRGV